MFENVPFVSGREYRDYCKKQNQENMGVKDPEFPGMVLLAGYLKSKLALPKNGSEPTQEWIQAQYKNPTFASPADQALYSTMVDNIARSPSLKKDDSLLTHGPVLEYRISPAGFMNALANQFFDPLMKVAKQDPWQVIKQMLKGNGGAILEIQLEDRYTKLSDRTEKAAMLASYLIVREAQPGNMNIAAGLPPLSSLLNHPSLEAFKTECTGLLSGVEKQDLSSSLASCFI